MAIHFLYKTRAISCSHALQLNTEEHVGKDLRISALSPVSEMQRSMLYDLKKSLRRDLLN
jgi:hypothetical protein